MGSSHSYLQNLEVTTTPYHQLFYGLCFEYAIPVDGVHQALGMKSIAGPCADTEYTQMDNTTYTVNTASNPVALTVWEIPQEHQKVAPNWTALAEDLKEIGAIPTPTVMPALMNLEMADIKVMHLKDWCYKNDSAKAKKICPQPAQYLVNMQQMPVSMNENATTVPVIKPTIVPVMMI